MKGFILATLSGVLGLVVGVILIVVLTFATAMIVAKKNGDPTAQGAYAFSLFYTVPVFALIGFIAGTMTYVLTK